MPRARPAKLPPRITNRQRLLLRLLAAMDGQARRLDFQKLLFLYCQQVTCPPYEFVPYRFGAFSFTSYADCRKLVDRDLLADVDGLWSLTKAADRLAGGTRDLEMEAFIRAHESRGDELVADTYRRFPFFATKSEVAKRVLAGDRAALTRIAAAKPKPSPKTLFTIGYEGKSLEGYLNQLLHAGATLLCDVRRNPLSRKYGFAKRTLATACESVGIRYEHVPELGIASAKRRGLESREEFQRLFVEYERETLPNERSALERIKQWIDDGEGVALTCYELAAEDCHRHCVAEALHDGIRVAHL